MWRVEKEIREVGDLVARDRPEPDRGVVAPWAEQAAVVLGVGNLERNLVVRRRVERDLGAEVLPVVAAY